MLNIYLPFITKIIENVVCDQLHNFMNLCSHFAKFQSGFQPYHSTETALKVLNDIQLNTDSGKISVLILLDLCAAFDTVDHNILLDRLELSGWTFRGSP